MAQGQAGDGATAARRAAVGILLAVLGDGTMLADVLADPAGPLAGLAPPDRARAQRLATETLRRLEPADRLLAPHLRRAPPARVRAILRLAAVELAERPGDAHGIVNAAVTLARDDRRSAAAAGMVNAVLRKLAAAPGALAAQPVQRMPQWLRQPLVRRWGREVVTAIETVQAQGAPLDLTPKDAAMTAAIATSLGGMVLPTGSVRLATAGQVSALPGHAAGDWWVQDAAAAIPARMLAARPGERVLDLCAAPGGKTLQLAAAGAEVTALDISGPRLARVDENLRRCGLSARLVAADALHWTPPDGAGFDAVLLDAPCSATGTIRRHPDLPFVRQAADVSALAMLQSRLFDRAVALLRPGGRLVFCTCSLLPEEGEDQLFRALADHPDLTPDPAPLPPGVPSDWAAPGGGLRLRPDHWATTGGIDGFFIAALRRAGA